jgi:hypothetical protein
LTATSALSGVDRIIHAAGCGRFGISEETYQQVN